MRTTISPVAIVAFATCLSLATAQAQPAPSPLTSYSTNIRTVLDQLKGGPYQAAATPTCMTDGAFKIVSIECQNQLGFLQYLSGYSSFRSFLRTAQETLVNHALGSSTSGAGSTSIVSKASVPEVIGLAVEAGALTQSSSGSTSTFTGNARGMYRYLTGGEVFPYCPTGNCDTFFSRNARRLSASVSLDNTSSGTTAAPTSGTTSNPSASTPATSLSGANWRMSSWGVKYQIPLGKLDVTGPDFRKAWDAQIAHIVKAGASDPIAVAAKTLNSKLADALDSLEKSKDYKDWQAAAMAEMRGLLKATPLPAPEVFESRLRIQLDKLAKLVTDKSYISSDQVSAALSAANGFFARRDDVLSVVRGHLPGLSFAYTNSHPLNQANVSNFKLIFQFQPKPGKLALTANGAADFYDSLPAGNTVGRWRDLQVAGQADWTLPSQYGNPVLSFAGYYQYMATKAVLQIPAGNTVPGTNIVLPGPAPTLLAPAGHIEIFQTSLTFPVKGGTTKVPVGVSWSNRTELLAGPVVRFHIGLNFNFDSLFTK